MESIADRITIDEKICNGKPTIRGKRIAVHTVLEFLSVGETKEEILKQYPSLESEDIVACLKFASELMNRNFTIKNTSLNSKTFDFLKDEEDLYQVKDLK